MSERACPKCGGITGYEFIIIARQIWYGQWEAPTPDYKGSCEPKEEYVEGERDSTGKTIVCLDCHKRMKRSVLGVTGQLEGKGL